MIIPQLTCDCNIAANTNHHSLIKQDDITLYTYKVNFSLNKEKWE